MERHVSSTQNGTRGSIYCTINSALGVFDTDKLSSAECTQIGGGGVCLSGHPLKKAISYLFRMDVRIIFPPWCHFKGLLWMSIECLRCSGQHCAFFPPMVRGRSGFCGYHIRKPLRNAAKDLSNSEYLFLSFSWNYQVPACFDLTRGHSPKTISSGKLFLTPFILCDPSWPG